MRRRIKVGFRAWIGIAVLTGAVVLSAPSAFGTGGTVSKPAATQQQAPEGSVYQGYLIFTSYFCAACHTLKQGGPTAYGQLGTNLNKKKVAYATAQAVVINGLPAALPLYPTQMVGYGNSLNQRQIRNVASFVSRYAGRPKAACLECPETE